MKYLRKFNEIHYLLESNESIDIEYNKYGGDVLLSGNKIGRFITLDMSNYLVLESIKIDEEYRGRGIGEKVNIISLTPSPFEPNFHELIRFYERLGFIENKGKDKIDYINEPFYLKKTK